MTALVQNVRKLAELGVTIRKDPNSLRFLGRWMRSLTPGHTSYQDSLPWMSFKVIRWLDQYLKPEMDVFEYGSGGSTPFIARRVRRLVSVEHDRRWYDLVARTLREQELWNCDLTFVPPARNPPVASIPYGPTSFTSFALWTRGYSFEAYARSIEEYPDRSFDLVLVDGYSRPSAVNCALPKVRRGGYLLLDDSDREYAWPALPLLESFPRTDFVGAAPFQRNLQQASVWRL